MQAWLTDWLTYYSQRSEGNQPNFENNISIQVPSNTGRRQGHPKSDSRSITHWIFVSHARAAVWRRGRKKISFVVLLALFGGAVKNVHRKRKHSQFFLNCFSLTIRYLNFRGFFRYIPSAFTFSFISLLFFSFLFLFFFTLTSIFILILIFALPDCHCHERHHHCHPEFGFFLRDFFTAVSL